MASGEWVLEYTGFDSSENHAPKYQVKLALLAINQTDAVEEAQELRPTIIRESYRGYNGQLYPQDTRVSYTVALDPKTLQPLTLQRKTFNWANVGLYNERAVRNAMVRDLRKEDSYASRDDVKDFLERTDLEIEEDSPDRLMTSRFLHSSMGWYINSREPSDLRWYVEFRFRGESLRNVIPTYTHPLDR